MYQKQSGKNDKRGDHQQCLHRVRPDDGKEPTGERVQNDEGHNDNQLYGSADTENVLENLPPAKNCESTYPMKNMKVLRTGSGLIIGESTGSFSARRPTGVTAPVSFRPPMNSFE